MQVKRNKPELDVPGTAQMEHFSTPEAEYEAYGCSILAWAFCARRSDLASIARDGDVR